MDFIELAASRRSIRKYDGRNIERRKLERCIEAARYAPSACNSQPWKFILVDDIAKQFNVPFRPVYLSREPLYDSYRIFCDRVRDRTEDEPPNVAVVHVRLGQDRLPLTSKLKQAEAKAQLAPLPLIVLSPKGQIPLEENAMAQRPHVCLPTPIAVSRFVRAFNSLVAPTGAPA